MASGSTDMTYDQIKILGKYYEARANESDKIYLKPERQDNIKVQASLLSECLCKYRILKILCGPNSWTEVIVSSAQSIVSTNMNEKVLVISKQRL